MADENIKYSVVVPVYNSQDTLAEFHKRISSVMKTLGAPYEFILVDDNSLDNSWRVMETIKKSDPTVTIIQLMKNFGQHNAIMCGFKFTRGSYVITLDDDLQHPPEEIPKLVSTITNKKHDIVYGLYISKKHNIFRNLGSEFIQLIYQRIFQAKENFTAFRIIKKIIVNQVVEYRGSFCFIDGLIAWRTGKIGYVRVKHNARDCGKSGYSIGKLVKLGLSLITNFSVFPLEVVSLIGMGISVIAFMSGIGILYQYFIHKIVVQGYTSIMVLLSFFSGLILFTLGIMGEYVGRIHLTLNEKPQYVIRKSVR